MTDQIVTQLAEISTKIDVLQQTQEKHTAVLEEQGRTLLRNTITVETHEKRSTLLEAEVKAIQDRITTAKGIGKFLKWLGAALVGAAGLAASIYEILSRK